MSSYLYRQFIHRPFFVILLLFTVIGSNEVYAQQRGRATVSGRILDGETGEAMIGTNVIVIDAEGKNIGGAVTLRDGSFNITAIPMGKLTVKASFVGYQAYTKEINIERRSQRINIGTIVLAPDVVLLDGTTITGELPQVSVKDDTVIYNAGAFRVPEGSVLEELIRKLPGAEVGDDGSVKINGKTVRRFLVEGKEFFGNDMNMAMKNIPTEIVEKVKSYERKSDLTRITGIDDGEEETVLDLTIKKGMKQGWFGNVDLAYGTKDRYAERFTVNRFADNTQVSLVGSYNNVNDTGFPGMGGRGRGGGGGGGGGGGETKSGMAGLNLALVRGNVEFGGNVRYRNTDSHNSTKSSVQNFVSTRTSYSNSMNAGKNINNNVNGDFRFEWKIDTMTTLQFRPNFSFSKSESESEGASATFNEDPYSMDGVDDPLNQMDFIIHDIKTNYNKNASNSDSHSDNVSGNLLFNRRLSTTGRNLSIRMNGNYSKTKNDNFNTSNVTYFQRGDSTALTYRYRQTPNSNKSYSIGFTYSEPIARAVFLQLNYQYSYSKRHSDGKTFDLGGIENMLDSLAQFGNTFLPYNYRDYLDDALSRYTDNENYNHNIETSLRVVREHYNLNVGVQMQPQRQKVDYDYQNLDTVAARNFFRISPTLNFRYRFTRQENLQVTYRGNTQQPSITDLFNTTDNSNPLNIREGNPELKPSFSNNFNVNYNKSIIDLQRSFFGGFSFSNTLNSISNRTQYNEETGGRITKPTNINGNWNLNGNAGFNMALIPSRLMLNFSTNAGYNNRVSYIYQNNESMKNKVKDLNLGERLTFTWREEYFDIAIHGNLNYTHTRSLLVSTSNQDTYRFNYGISTNVNLPINLSLSTNISMNSRRGYSSSQMNTNELIWNAQVAYRFLKNKQATVSLQAYDILAKRSNISRSIDANRRSDTETNEITSYVMAHFIYRLNLFGTREARRNMRQGMREGREMDFGPGRGGDRGGRGGRGGGFPGGGGPGGGGGFPGGGGPGGGF